MVIFSIEAMQVEIQAKLKCWKFKSSSIQAIGGKNITLEP
jgi:hypothetical protein